MQIFRERLTPSWWMVTALGLAVPAFYLVFVPLSALLGLSLGLLFWIGLVAAFWLSAPTLTLDPFQFRAGRAVIEQDFIQSVEAFEGSEAREQRGIKLDARAWLLFRPWIDGVVKITLCDPNDPTPYWLVSSKRPHDLVRTYAIHRAPSVFGDTQAAE